MCFFMAEPDVPYAKPATDLSQETNEVTPPSPDVKNPLPDHDPLEKLELGAFICPVCGKSFNTKADLDLHLARNHRLTTKA
jgi:hypothetical protein